MDPGRFILHPAGWDDKSALGRYNPVHNPDYRVGGPYAGRGYTDPGFPTENGFNRGGFPRDVLLDRDRYQMAPPGIGLWHPPRRNAFEDDIGVVRGPQRHGKSGYGDGYRDSEYREPHDSFRDVDKFTDVENFRESDNVRDHDFDRGGRSYDTERRDFEGDDNDYKRSSGKGSREGSYDRDYPNSRYDDEYDSDHDKDRRDHGWHRSRKRDRERHRSSERDESPERGRRRERSHSHGLDHHSRRSRSSSRGYSRDRRERSYEDVYDSHNDKKSRTREERRHREYQAVAPSATLVVKGLSQRTVEDDIYRALAEWGPLRHVRVIKERSTGMSRGFAFIDFPSVDAASKMMDDVGDNGLVVDGRRLFFEYSSKPTGGSQADHYGGGSGKGGNGACAVDWMCIVCGCVNFARRTSCFQCNEPRTDDAPPADISSSLPSGSGKKGSETGPTHVLVVRGLDENINEELLHYEFSKYAPIKDLRLVRDKFTHISKGFAFVHFHSVEDSTKALQATNGITLDKNGQPLRVAYAKSIYGPSSSSSTQSNNSLASAAIEAATFAQQYDAVGWAPKEYNPDQAPDSVTVAPAADSNTAPQAGFVWDEASGYYYDASSGFYYDGHRGLYYDGNHGIWYTYNQETQQYEPYVAQDSDNTTVAAAADVHKGTASTTTGTKPKDATTVRKAVISAPPSTVHTEDTKTGLAEAIKGTAVAAQATMKKDKSRKNILPSSKTKISGVPATWKHKQEVPTDQASVLKTSTVDEKSKNLKKPSTNASALSSGAVGTFPKKIQGVIHTKETLNKVVLDDVSFVSDVKHNPSANTSMEANAAGSVTVPKKFEGIIHTREYNVHAAGRSPVFNEYHAPENTYRTSGTLLSAGASLNTRQEHPKSDHSSVGSFRGQPTGGRRRFTEAPQNRF